MNKIPEQLYQFLLYFYDTPENSFIHKYISHCDLYIQPDYNSIFPSARHLIIIVSPEVYKSYSNSIESFGKIIARKLKELIDISLTKIITRPDLNKFQILKNNYTPVLTPWEQINTGQNHLIELLRTANKTVDYQNIGNTSRTLLQNLSTLIFDPQKHIAENMGIDLGEGKFKNRLHTYIKCELPGQENLELRNFAVAAITTAEKAVDLSNKLTHDLKAHSVLAESCVISTIAAIGIVRTVGK